MFPLSPIGRRTTTGPSATAYPQGESSKASQIVSRATLATGWLRLVPLVAELFGEFAGERDLEQKWGFPFLGRK